MNLPARELKTAIPLVLGLKAAALLILFAGWFFIPRADWGIDSWMTRPDTSFVDNLANFDGAWFVRLAVLGPERLATGDYDQKAETRRLRVMDELGYEQGRWPRPAGDGHIDRGYGYRHWPGFVWSIRAAAALGFDPVWSAVVLSNLFTLAYGVVLYLLASKELNREAAVFCVFLSQFHPGGYALSGAYNESMFLMVAAGSMLAARQRRWWLSGLLCLVAAQTRIFGVVLAAPLAYEWLEARAEAEGRGRGFGVVLGPEGIKRGLKSMGEWPGPWWLLLAPLGTLTVLWYYQQAGGDMWIWTRVHEANQYGHVNWPWLMMLATYHKGPQIWMKELPLHALLLVVLILSFRKARGSYWLWMALFFLYHTTNGNHSYLRYQTQCVPLFIVMAQLWGGKARWRTVIGAIFAGLFGLFAAMFINGYWVA